MTAGGSAPPVLGGMQGPSSLGVYGGMNQLPPYGGGAGPYGMDPCGGMNPLTGTMMPPYRGGAGPYGMDPFADPHRMVPYGRRASPYGGWESPMMTRSAKPSAKPTKPAAPKKPLLSAATGQPANVKLLAKSLDKFYKLHLPGGELCAIKSLHAACSFRALFELDLVWARAYARSVQARGAHRHGPLQRHWCVEQDTVGAVWRRSYQASTRSAPGVCARAAPESDKLRVAGLYREGDIPQASFFYAARREYAEGGNLTSGLSYRLACYLA